MKALDFEIWKIKRGQKDHSNFDMVLPKNSFCVSEAEILELANTENCRDKNGRKKRRSAVCDMRCMQKQRASSLFVLKKIVLRTQNLTQIGSSGVLCNCSSTS